MTAINWDSRSKRLYEAGLDRGVLYTRGSPGVPWYGLRSIEESIDGGEPKPYYMDGIKYLNIASLEEYKASISAINYPKEFNPCDGNAVLAKGLTLTQQERQSFSLCYRTLVGSDTMALGFGYKLHLIYNALARPSSRTHASLQAEPSMEMFTWECSTKAIPYAGYRPIAHLVIDSRTSTPAYLTKLESYLYGSATREPMLLDPGQIAATLSGEDVSFEEV